jgi:hypothetical protein
MTREGAVVQVYGPHSYNILCRKKFNEFFRLIYLKELQKFQTFFQNCRIMFIENHSEKNLSLDTVARIENKLGFVCKLLITF